MENKKIRIGTRGSKLALWQAHFIESQLNHAGFSTSIVEISSKGDKILDVSLAKIGSKGLFTEELEQMLCNGEIDIAVHSAKDVQSNLGDDLELIAFTEREEANDVLVGFEHVDLGVTHKNLIVGTSSTRRVAFLRHFYPHINIVDMRGNLQTRFEKLQNGHCHAMILAYAGVHRMNYDDFIIQKFPLDTFTPPVGQGTIAVQCAKSLNPEMRKSIIEAVNHRKTEICLRAERMFLQTMEGGCSVPTFAYAHWINDNEINIRAGIISLDGTSIVNQFLTVPAQEAEKAGEVIAKKVLQLGGKKILDGINKMTATNGF